MNSPHWSFDSIFYHIYPLGLCGAPARNDFHSAPEPRLEQLHGWIPHLRELGVNAIYLGPLFESSAHGYDTADYYHVDRRLGDDAGLARLSEALHASGMRLILDGVFNHVGRDFWAFRDVRRNLSASPFCSWFHLDFDRQSPYGDPFAYEGWSGYYDLVKLNLKNPDVRNHLFGAIESWVRDFHIDGLRLDVADSLDPDFMKELHSFCRGLRPDFWLMGEAIHGDYRRLANAEMLDSVTNYECYKGLYSSLVDKNYFEIAWSLNRQFGEDGLYRDLPLYNFADNHDVDRVASSLGDPLHLHPLYCLLFSMPGVPSIYYGSEWGLEGVRRDGDDSPLRPALTPDLPDHSKPQPDLARLISHLARLRIGSPALKYGSYRQLHVAHQQLAFVRQVPGECVIVALNAAPEPARLELPLPVPAGRWEDLLNPGEAFQSADGKLAIDIPPHRARILRASI
jgi:glycosidase